MIKKVVHFIYIFLGLMVHSGEPEKWPNLDLSSTRDLFPLNTIALNYRPSTSTLVGKNKFALSFQIIRSNTLEFSESLKNELMDNDTGRVKIDFETVDKFAKSHPNEKLIYYFDTEIQSSEIKLRYGLTSNTDVAISLSWRGVSGGFFDGLIEDFHKLGFKQFGRDHFQKNQSNIIVVQNGNVVVFSQEKIDAQFEYPIVQIFNKAFENKNLTITFVGSIQFPGSHWHGVYRSKWDSSLGIASQWRPNSRQTIDSGVAYLRRGLRKDGPAPFFIKDQVAAHLGWEWRAWSRCRPYILLLGTNGITYSGPGSKLDRFSLVHDLGAHIRTGNRSAITIGYINNISHNENTSDMGLSIKYSTFF